VEAELVLVLRPLLSEEAKEAEKLEENEPAEEKRDDSSHTPTAAKASPAAQLSAKVLSCKLLGVLEEPAGCAIPLEEEAMADAAEQLMGLKLLGKPGALQQDVMVEKFGGLISSAYSLGAFEVTRRATVVCQVILQNDGPTAWPKGCSLQLCMGSGFGFQALELAEIGSGEAFQVLLDLSLDPENGKAKGESCWCLVKEGGEEIFGTLLCASSK